MTERDATSKRGVLDVTRVLVLALVGILMLRLAWISDDSLITLRTALNFTHRWGVGFNVDEAVQGYTHPLWFLLWSAVGSLTNEWILSILLVSVTLSLIAVSLILWKCKSLPMVVATGLLLVSSNAFMEYSTSGLEAPLAYLGIGLLFVQVQRSFEPLGSSTRKHAVAIGLTVALVVLTRYDLVLLVAPAFALLVWTWRGSVKQLTVLLASSAVPLGLWFVWSWGTYASVLPNTYEAKRNLGIPLLELGTRGLQYLLFSWRWDLVTGLIVIGTCLAVLVWGRTSHRLWALGVALYLAYVVSNGGDFMAGRFLAVPTYLSIALLVSVVATCTGVRVSDFQSQHLFARGWRLAVSGSFAAVALIAGLWVVDRAPTSIVAPTGPRWNYEDSDYSLGVADERGVWVGWAQRSIWDLDEVGDTRSPRSIREANPKSSLATLSRIASRWPQQDRGCARREAQVDVVPTVLGTYGILLGPTHHLIDEAALTDRFLAGRPFLRTGDSWRAGHYFRQLPKGYFEAVVARDPAKVSDPKLAAELSELWRSIRAGCT